MRWELFRLIEIGILLNFVGTGFSNDLSDEDETDDFTCIDGSKIPTEHLCDGTWHCPDRSDETLLQCVQLSRLHENSCVYGAQIHRSKFCDGKRDCVDNSDELENYCKWFKADKGMRTIMENQLQGSCGNEEMFECATNECINFDEICDGKYDCSNNLDESPEICMRSTCGTSFTCSYGACISEKKLCDGVADCADGSDEILDMPNCSKTFRLPQYPKIGSELFIPRIEKYCHIPPKNNLKIFSITSRVGNDITFKRNSIEYVKENKQVEFGCEKGHTLSGNRRFACGKNDTWSNGNALPKCEKYCKHFPESVTYKIECSYDGTTKVCGEIMPPKTILNVTCAYNYHHTANFTSSVKCQENGEWSGILEPCKQTCGEIEKATVPFAHGGIAANTSMAPWQVAIYLENNSDWLFICSGTILRADLIVTAAHCVTSNTTNPITKAASEFLVVSNKEYSDYKKGNSEQKKIHDIYVHPDYRGSNDNYLNDVALMHLEQPMQFSIHERPICGPTVKMFNLIVTNNTFGHFSAYNYHRGNLVLVHGNITHNFINQKQFKFLLGYNAQSHQGDSGSGIFITFDEKNYLIGILSSGSGMTTTKLSVTSLLDYHIIKFIRNYISYF